MMGKYLSRRSFYQAINLYYWALIEEEDNGKKNYRERKAAGKRRTG